MPFVTDSEKIFGMPLNCAFYESASSGSFAPRAVRTHDRLEPLSETDRIVERRLLVVPRISRRHGIQLVYPSTPPLSLPNAPTELQDIIDQSALLGTRLLLLEPERRDLRRHAGSLECSGCGDGTGTDENSDG